ncbi:MAG: efflux RND transporter periplasmic adaptor subunit, partial [Planctomycetes bacterium]|nr:efflux RND transporter periplasmic adaptor subunit [Planctomycetota bacterium]
AKGQEVRERQDLFHLPTENSMMAEIQVHESSLKKVHSGLPARVTVSAVPGKIFHGTLGRIAPMPDARSAHMNPDLKVYNSEIYLHETNGELRTGMSCSAEIIVEEHQNALYVPIQSIQQVDGKPTVFVVNEDGQSEPRTIKTGLDNNRVAHVLEGLEEGDRVLLAPPLVAGATPQGRPEGAYQGETEHLVSPKETSAAVKAPPTPQEGQNQSAKTTTTRKSRGGSRQGGQGSDRREKPQGSRRRQGRPGQ